MSRLGPSTSSKSTALFNDPKFGDCTVHCSDGRSFHCSKWKLAEASEFFYKSLSGAWIESTSSVINLEESDSAPIEAMLYYIHTGQYVYNSAPAPQVTIAQHISLFTTADFYCVDSLRGKAREFFEQKFPRLPVGDEWFEAVEQVYGTTLSRDGGLGETVIKTAMQKMWQLTEWPEERWLKLCLRYPDVLRDLFRKLRAGQQPPAGMLGDFGGPGASSPAAGPPPTPLPGGPMVPTVGPGAAPGGSVSIAGFGGAGRTLGGGGGARSARSGNGAGGRASGPFGGPGNTLGGGGPSHHHQDDEDDTMDGNGFSLGP